MADNYAPIQIAAAGGIGRKVGASAIIVIGISRIRKSIIGAVRGVSLTIIGSCPGSLAKDARIKLLLLSTYPVSAFNPSSDLFVFRVEFYPVPTYISSDDHFSCPEIIPGTCGSASGFRINATPFLDNSCQAIVDEMIVINPAGITICGFNFYVFSAIGAIIGLLSQPFNDLSEFDSSFSAVFSARSGI